MLDFSLLVGVTRRSISLAGRPAVLSCRNGFVLVMHARKGTVLLAEPLPRLRFAHGRNTMVSVTGPHGRLNLFGAGRYRPVTLRLMAERQLPPLVGAAQAATWFPDAFELPSEFSSAFANVTRLLPRLLAANGVTVVPR